MLIKCICTNCAGHLEFEEENAGEKIKCPHCGFETTLFLPGAEPVHPLVAAALRRRKRNRVIALSAGAAVVLGVGWAVYHWGMPLIEDFFPTVDSQTFKVLLLLLGCLLVPLALAWAAFPLVVFFQLRKVCRLLSELQRTFAPPLPEESANFEPSEEVTEENEPDQVTAARGNREEN